MKRITIPFLLLILTGFAGSAFAHHDPHVIVNAPGAQSAAVSPKDSSMQHDMAEHEVMESVDAFPNYHPLIVHFPVVLLLMAVLFQFLSFFVYRKEFSVTTMILLFLGVLASWLASNTFHADPGPLPPSVMAVFNVHEQMASLTWWFSLVALLIKVPTHFFLKERKW